MHKTSNKHVTVYQGFRKWCQPASLSRSRKNLNFEFIPALGTCAKPISRFRRSPLSVEICTIGSCTNPLGWLRSPSARLQQAAADRSLSKNPASSPDYLDLYLGGCDWFIAFLVDPIGKCSVDGLGSQPRWHWLAIWFDFSAATLVWFPKQMRLGNS